MDAVQFSATARARVMELVAQTGQRNVPLHMVTAINEMIAVGLRIRAPMLAATPLRHAIPGNEDRTVKRVTLLHTEDGMAYIGVEFEP